MQAAAMADTVCVTEDGGHFRLETGNWSGVYPIDCLPAQLAFYIRLRDRNGRRYAAYYADTVAVLEKLARDLGVLGQIYDKPPKASPSLTVSPPLRQAVHTTGHDSSQLSFGL